MLDYLGILKKSKKFPLWLSTLTTWHSVREDAGSIPGLVQWVLPRHRLWDKSQMQLGSSIAEAVVSACSCSSYSTPSPGTSICSRCRYKKKKKKKNPEPQAHPRPCISSFPGMRGRQSFNLLGGVQWVANWGKHYLREREREWLSG